MSESGFLLTAHLLHPRSLWCHFKSMLPPRVSLLDSAKAAVSADGQAPLIERHGAGSCRPSCDSADMTQ